MTAPLARVPSFFLGKWERWGLSSARSTLLLVVRTSHRRQVALLARELDRPQAIHRCSAANVS